MLNYEYPPLGGGAAPVTKSIAEKLVELHHDVDVLTMGFQDLNKEELINGVHIIRVPSFRKNRVTCNTGEMGTYCCSAWKTLHALLKKNRYDINHTHFIIPTGIVSYLYKSQIPYIITAHGSDVPGYNPDRFGFQHIISRPIWKKVVTGSSCITSPSNYLKELIQQNTHYPRIQVIPNGINSDLYNPKEKENKILVVSRLLKRKGIQHVIEAMQGIRDYQLVICGDGPYRYELEQKVKKMNLDNTVKFLGYVENEQLISEFETSSIFILPSASESFGMVLLEAMASGCAVISSNDTGCPETIGDAGLVVQSGNVEDIHNTLSFLIQNDDLIKKFALKGRNRAKNEFNWDTIIMQYIKCYEKAISENSKPNA
jgi:glycosyltransferase involved in cell wall biosynthesis